MMRTELQPADQLTVTLLVEILKHLKFRSDNLGATTPMELAIVARKTIPFLHSRGIAVERIYAGTFLSSLDMAVLTTIDYYPVDDIPATLQALAHTLRHQLGGSSGPRVRNFVSALRQRTGARRSNRNRTTGTDFS